MRQWLQNLSDTLVDRFVPKAEAAAATNCWTDTICGYTGASPVCGSSGHRYTQTITTCSDGTVTYGAFRCGC
ncbi:hypothetical protein [Kitasatospora sp. NBC_00315]|uniref:hypothetical protein n=1 Tax=Kitasatospora sp. NBC_00315 TaxID=2975963 RepID=UPI0032536EF3